MVSYEVEPGVYQNLFPEEVAERVPAMLRKLDLIWVCLLVVGLITITNYEKPVREPTEDSEEEKDQ